MSLTSFVGREHEVAVVRRLQAGTRLLTLTGSGGVGKTRLALAVAEELLWAYPHGVWLVELAGLADPALVPQTVATALGLQATEPSPPMEALIAFLRPRHLLLILDNCEHLPAACAELTEALLRACPNLEVVATSRVPLGVAGETVWRVPPMAVAPGAGSGERGAGFSGGAEVAQNPAPGSPLPAPASDAVRLFAERARLYRPEFALSAGNVERVAELCRRLDGIPLAIELAAARVSMLSVDGIAARLEDRLRLLTGGSRTALPRHQTMRAALDWSYALLSPDERSLLRRLSVFAGGFTLEAAEVVGGATGNGQWAIGDGPTIADCPLSIAPDVLDLLASLVDHSLVSAEEEDGAIRYRLLETVRQYAGEQLDDAGEAEGARGGHVAWHVALVEAADGAFVGPDQRPWLVRLEREHDNLRAALGWSLLRKDGESALRLAAGLARFWEVRGYLREGREWLGRALVVGEAAQAALRARALHGAGNLSTMLGDYAGARVLFEQCLTLNRQTGDRREVARAEGSLGATLFRLGAYPEARATLEASLAVYADLGDKRGIAGAHGVLGLLALRQGDLGRARALMETRLALNRELGYDDGVADSLEDLATLAGEEGDYARGAELLQESLALWRRLGHANGVALALGSLGMAAWMQGDADGAHPLLAESLALYQQVGDRRGIARTLGYQGTLALFDRDYVRAEALSRQCVALYRRVGDRWALGRYLTVLAGATFGLGRPERATRLFAAAAHIRERLGSSLPLITRAPYERTLAALRTALGDAAFEAAWSAGEAMSEEAVLDDALADAATG